MIVKVRHLTYEECKDEPWTLSFVVHRNPSIIQPRKEDEADKTREAEHSSPESPDE
jgi:hypothetical protein